MQLEQDPRIVIDDNDINRMFRDVGGMTAHYDEIGNVSIDLKDTPGYDFPDEIVQHFIKDASTAVVTDSLVHAVQNSHGHWTPNEIESLVAVLNEKFGTGVSRTEFLMSEEFKFEGERPPEGEIIKFSEDTEQDWSDEEVEEFLDNVEDGEEEDEPGMLDHFDPSDNIKQEAAIEIEKLGFDEEQAMHIADHLRTVGLLAEE